MVRILSKKDMTTMRASTAIGCLASRTKTALLAYAMTGAMACATAHVEGTAPPDAAAATPDGGARPADSGVGPGTGDAGSINPPNAADAGSRDTGSSVDAGARGEEDLPDANDSSTAERDAGSDSMSLDAALAMGTEAEDSGLGGDGQPEAAAAASSAGDGAVDASDVGVADAAAPSPNPTCPQRELNTLGTAQTMLLKGHADALTFSLACDDPGPRIVISSSHDSPLWSNEINHRTTSSLILFAGPEQQVTVPESMLDNFEHLEPGRDVWLFSESQQDQMLWPGIQSYEVPIAAVPNGLRLELVTHEGPGRVQLYVALPSELRFMLDTGPSHELRSTEIQSEVHMHMSWVFDQPGLYRLSFRAQGELVDGTPVTSELHELRVLVGDSPAALPATEPPVVVVEPQFLEDGSALLQARRVGEQDTELALHWHEQCLDYNVEPWLMSDWLTMDPDDESDPALLSAPAPDPESGIGCQYRASLVDAAGSVVSQSQAWVFE
jgi:surface-anchored protein